MVELEGAGAEVDGRTSLEDFLLSDLENLNATVEVRLVDLQLLCQNRRLLEDEITVVWVSEFTLVN